MDKESRGTTSLKDQVIATHVASVASSETERSSSTALQPTANPRRPQVDEGISQPAPPTRMETRDNNIPGARSTRVAETTDEVDTAALIATRAEDHNTVIRREQQPQLLEGVADGRVAVLRNDEGEGCMASEASVDLALKQNNDQSQIREESVVGPMVVGFAVNVGSMDGDCDPDMPFASVEPDRRLEPTNPVAIAGGGEQVDLDSESRNDDIFDSHDETTDSALLSAHIRGESVRMQECQSGVGDDSASPSRESPVGNRRPTAARLGVDEGNKAASGDVATANCSGKANSPAMSGLEHQTPERDQVESGDNAIDVEKAHAKESAGACPSLPHNRQEHGAFRMIGDRVVSDEDLEVEQEEHEQIGEENGTTPSTFTSTLGDYCAGVGTRGGEPIIQARLVDEEAQAHRMSHSTTMVGDDPISSTSLGSNVVIENVVMDAEARRTLSRRTSSLRIVQASPMKEMDNKRPLWRMRKLQLFSLALIIVTAGVTLAIVYGLQTNKDDSGGNPTPVGAPTGRGVSPQSETTPTPTSAPSAVENGFASGEPTMVMLGATRESFVNDVLPEYTRSALQDPDSDQSRALDWLWSDPSETAALPLFRRVQRYAIAVNYLAGTKSETGDQIARSGYMNSEHECSWPQKDGVCNVDGQFQVIDKADNSFVVGSIPPEIGLLTHLVTFDISKTKMEGSIPSTLGLLSQSLQHFVADKTELSGAIPSEIGHLGSLLELTLSESNLTSRIPTEVGLMEGLQTLALNENSLTGPIPSEVGQLHQSLRMFGLHNNRISGSLPSELGLLTKLMGLALIQTNITGPLPSEFGNLVMIEELFAHNTALNGTIPAEMEALTELSSLTLHETRLVGTFPLCNLTVDGGSLNLYTVSCPMVECSCNCTCATSQLEVDSNWFGRICGFLGIGWLCG